MKPRSHYLLLTVTAAVPQANIRHQLYYLAIQAASYTSAKMYASITSRIWVHSTTKLYQALKGKTMPITGLIQKLAVGLALGFSTTSSFAQTTSPLYLLIWESYIAPEVIQLWEQATSIPVELVYFDNEELRDEIIFTHKPVNFDLAILDNVTAKLFESTPHIQPLDQANIKGSKNHALNWRQHCGNNAMPYTWGTLGIVYRSDKVNPPPTSWRDLLQPDVKLAGHIGLINDYSDTLVPSLSAQNASINSDDQAELKRAFKDLSTLLPAILTFEYPISFLQSNRQADALHMALAFSGDQSTMNEIVGGEPRWKYVIPSEGTSLWVDCLAVLDSSKQKQAAIKFIEFLNQPKIAALNANWVGVATTNTAAAPYLDKQLLSDTTIYPDSETLAKTQLQRPLTKENMLRRDRIVSALLNRYESM